ncbi:MAG TPA: cytochrome P450 [Mycobacterium sp.]|nr:cytochrome P450 [Mycobacterium sp.]
MEETVRVDQLPLAPKNPLSYSEQVKALRSFHTGCETLRDAGGLVTRCRLGPDWMMPSIVVTTSPRGARDVLTRSYPFVDHVQPTMNEHRRLFGGSLFNFRHDAWLPRRRALQPVFTKKHVTQFAGHMSECGQTLAAGWASGADVDLDQECRKLTVQVLARSVLGLNLDDRADPLGEPLRSSLTYVANRAAAPLRVPAWLPTPARRRARAASAALHGLAEDVLRACQTDPSRDAPLVRTLIDVADPDTGQPLSDEDVCHELVVFMAAGHDTTATTLTYAMWALGHHPDLQRRVAEEVLELGDRPLTADDVPRLGFTVQILNEALRLCPPAAATTRMATQDFAVDGYRIEAGTLVLVGIYAMHRDPTMWERPLQFDPDRFSEQKSKGRDRWQYLPFGGGPRSCIGDHFAMLEATLGLATIIRSVEIESLHDDFPVAVPFTTVADAPIMARVRRRI